MNKSGAYALAEKATAQADALLKAGDALGKHFPAKSRELLRLCRVYREKAKRYREHATSTTGGE